MVTIEIDGTSYQAEAGTLLIQFADAHGINIPRFCYHQKLSIAASCRMCLVEVEKAPKPMPACATPITDGMKVWTRSPKALAAQKAVMEFLLINHPLDCPICDQGGECELQDLAVGYGKDHSHYQEEKRVVFDKNLGPLIATEMTRCIHCTRCVRFGEEIAGVREMGATGRGEHTLIGTYLEQSVTSELSGNVIDLCPVGALTAKPSRFTARAWELQEYPSIAPHDALGSPVHVHVRRGQVMRVVPRQDEAINEVWLSDRDRFGYLGLSAPDRLTQPMIKQNGQWRSTDWQTALTFTVNGLRAAAKNPSVELGGMIAPTATLEELYLFQSLLRGIGCHNIDHRLTQLDFGDDATAPLAPQLGQSLTNLEHSDNFFIIGAHLRKEQPLLNHRVRKAALKGATVSFLSPLAYTHNFPITQQQVLPPAAWVNELAGITKAVFTQLGTQAPVALPAVLDKLTATAQQIDCAQILLRGQQRTLLLGQLALNHPQFSALRALANLLATLLNAQLGYLPPAANSVGAWLAGAIPHRGPLKQTIATPGLHAKAMWERKLPAYMLLGLEPELDSVDGQLALTALQSAQFVVSCTAYRTSTLDSYAHVLLPMALFTETSGTYVNLEGRWQSFTGITAPPGEARPAWKILRVLGNLFELAEFDHYHSSEQIRDHLGKLLSQQNSKGSLNSQGMHAEFPLSKLPLPNVEAIQRITEIPPYSIDPLVRRSLSLQNTPEALFAAGLHLAQQLADQYQLKAGDRVKVTQGPATVQLPVVIDDRVPAQTALIYAAQEDSRALGSWQGILTLGK